MQEYLRETVSNIIEDINIKYFLPDIQRDFVWKPNQICVLFDSLLRNYPINTLLFWKITGKFMHENNIKKLKFVSSSNEINKVDTASISKQKDYYLVLDGQQRLTAFYLVLKGNYIIRNKKYDLYFNVLSGSSEEDGILYEFNFFNEIKGENFLENNKLWIKVKDIYSIDSIFKIQNYINVNLIDKYKIQLTIDQMQTIQKLLYTLKDDKIIYYYPESEEDYDKVLDIFIRTNAGGTKLSYSDLLFSTIKSNWDEAREKFSELLFSINDNNIYNFSIDFVLKTILFINANDMDSLKYKTKNFSKHIIKSLKDENKWKKLSSSICLIKDLIKDKFYLTNDKLLTSYNAMIPLVYWIYSKNIKSIGSSNNCLDEEQIKIIRVWFIKALLSGVFGGQSDSILYKCKQAIDDNSSSKSFPALKIEEKIKNDTKKSMQVDLEDLEKIKYNDNNSNLVLSIIYKSSINFQPSLNLNMPQQDHIFSKHELESNNFAFDDINTIFNIRFVGKTPNQIKSCRPYSEWITTQTQDEKAMHHIPEGEWNVINYLEFIKRRKEIFINQFDY